MGVPATAGVSASGRSPYFPNDQANGVIQGTLTVGPSKPFAFLGPMNLFLWSEFVTSAAVTIGDATVSVGAAGLIAAGAGINSTNLPKGTTVGTFGGTDAEVVLPTYTYTGKVLKDLFTITELQSTQYLLGAAVAGPGIAASTTVAEIVRAAVAPTTDLPDGIKGIVRLNNAVTLQPPNSNKQPFEFTLAVAGLVTANDAAAIFTGWAIGLTGTVQLERSFDGGGTWIPCNIGSSGAQAIWSTANPVSVSFGEPERMILYRLNCVTLTGVTNYSLHYRISETGQAATTLAVPTI